MRKFRHLDLSAQLIFLFFFFHTTAQTTLRKKINIDGNWKFHFGNAADPEKDFNYSIATIFRNQAAQSNGDRSPI